MKWSFSQIWNESLTEGREERELKVRDYIFASEIGGAFIDRFLQMKAEPPTNPPNVRSLRKFEAGNLLQWVVELVLRRAGIIMDTEKMTRHQYNGLLPVIGRLDFLAGGQPDWDKAVQEIEGLHLPKFFNRASHRIIQHFKEKFPEGLEKVVLEIKSCSTYMFDRYEKYGLETSNHHVLQLFHYLKAEDMKEGHLIYICKDDLRMLEFGVFNPSQYEDFYKRDVETMSNFWTSNTPPPLEPEVIFNHDTCKFSTNWKVEYSTYLTKLYGYQEPIHYRERWDKTINQWNRTFGRCVRGDKMTDLNLRVIEDIRKYFPDFDLLVEEAKTKISMIEEKEEEENE